MKCTVFRSSLKDFTYIYLQEGLDFEDLPTELKALFGTPELVMNLELTAQRKLAYADVTEVMQSLSDQGYYLQMPPKEDETGLLDLPK